MKLSNHGHGIYYRLFYQLDQFTQQVKVNTKALLINHQANNGFDMKSPISEFVTHAVTFQDILDLLNTQNYGIHEGEYIFEKNITIFCLITLIFYDLIFSVIFPIFDLIFNW